MRIKNKPKTKSNVFKCDASEIPDGYWFTHLDWWPIYDEQRAKSAIFKKEHLEDDGQIHLVHYDESQSQTWRPTGTFPVVVFLNRVKPAENWTPASEGISK